jgi:hypothetical protein
MSGQGEEGCEDEKTTTEPDDIIARLNISDDWPRRAGARPISGSISAAWIVA